MRIFSGIQPTGRKHLGNYIGAIVQYVEGQQRAAEAGDVAIYCVVDLHAMTVPYDPAEMRERVYDTAAVLLAAGLDPERCIFIRQSDVPEHTELAWHLGSVCAHGDLNRMHQFKEKSARQRDLISADLFYYPVLMAADVLAYRADEVPVGDDQRQHVELMRDLAQRFNARYGEQLVVPELRIPSVGARIMDLQDPTSKMSTSSGSDEGRVYVLDDAKAIEKKFKRAVTDSADPPLIRRAPDKPGVSNLIDILAAASGRTPDQVEADLEGARGYGDLKVATAQAVDALLAPVRERYVELRRDEDALERIFADGAQKARAITSETLRDVRRAAGIGPRS
jgi:tryptophanyl-tRNA synthetase